MKTAILLSAYVFLIAAKENAPGYISNEQNEANPEQW